MEQTKKTLKEKRAEEAENRKNQSKKMIEDMQNQIKKNRPNITDSSVKSYMSILKALWSRIYGEDDFKIEKFENTKKILDFLKDVEPAKRKTILSALMAICEDKKKCDEYREVMLNDASIFNAVQKEQKMSDKQKENWLSIEQIDMKLNELFQKFDEATSMRGPVPLKLLHQAQDYVILSLTSGKYIPPRRNADWTEMRWKNYEDDEEEENVYTGRKFIFRIYKTRKYHGQQEIPVPKPLKDILDKWTKKIKSDYLLFDSNGEKLSSSQLTQRLNSIFDGKKASTTILRHIFLTDKYKNVPHLKDMEETASMMGHDLKTAFEYVKKS